MRKFLLLGALLFAPLLAWAQTSPRAHGPFDHRRRRQWWPAGQSCPGDAAAHCPRRADQRHDHHCQHLSADRGQLPAWRDAGEHQQTPLAATLMRNILIGPARRRRAARTLTIGATTVDPAATQGKAGGKQLIPPVTGPVFIYGPSWRDISRHLFMSSYIPPQASGYSPVNPDPVAATGGAASDGVWAKGVAGGRATTAADGTFTVNLAAANFKTIVYVFAQPIVPSPTLGALPTVTLSSVSTASVSGMASKPGTAVTLAQHELGVRTRRSPQA